MNKPIIHLDESSSSSSGGVDSYLGSFSNYSNLISSHPTADFGQLATTLSSEGTKYLPFNLGGTYRPEGTWVWDGAKWKSNTAEISKAINDLVLDQYKIKSTFNDPVPAYLVDELPSNNHIYYNFGIDGSNGNETLIAQIRQKFRPIISNRKPTNLDDISVIDPIVTAASFQTVLHSIGQDWVDTSTEIIYKATSLTLGSASWKRVTPDFYKRSKSIDFSRTNQTTEGLINQQANTYEDYLTLSITPLETDNYRVGTEFLASINTAGSNLLVQLTVTGGTVSKTFQIEIESKDAGGNRAALNILQGGIITGNITPGTDILIDGTHSGDLELEKGVAYEVKLRWTSEQNNVRAAIHLGQITCKQSTIS